MAASLAATEVVLLIRLRYLSWLPRRSEQVLVAAIWSAAPAVVAVAVVIAVFGVPVVVGVLVGVGLGAALFPAI